MTGELDEDTPWNTFLEKILGGYLDALERDVTAARAFIVEMDAAGPTARRRRREAVHGFARLVAARHATIRAASPALGPLPERAYLGLALGVRELVREALESDPPVRPTTLASDVLTWISAMVEGAAAASRHPRS